MRLKNNNNNNTEKKLFFSCQNTDRVLIKKVCLKNQPLRFFSLKRVLFSFIVYTGLKFFLRVFHLKGSFRAYLAFAVIHNQYVVISLLIWLQ